MTKVLNGQLRQRIGRIYRVATGDHSLSGWRDRPPRAAWPDRPDGPQPETGVRCDGSVETGCGVGASAPQRRSDVVDVHLAWLDHRLGVAAGRAHGREGGG